MKTINFLYNNENSIDEAIASIDIENPSDTLVQVYTKNSDKSFIQSLQEKLKSSLNQPKIIGTTSDGAILGNHHSKEETIISISFFENVEVNTMLLSCQGENSCNCNTLQNIIHSNTKLIFLFCDASNNNNVLILDSITKLAPNIPLIGGQGINKAINEVGIVFTEDKILDDGFVAATLNSDSLFVQTDSLFHWQPLGEEMVVTEAEDNIVKEINSRSVVDIYDYYLGSDVANNIVEFSSEFPLIIRKEDELIARAPIKVLEDNSLLLAGDIKIGDKVRFGFGNIAEIEKGVIDLKNSYKSKNIEALFTFSCMARETYLKDDFNVELAILNSIAPSTGFISWGEFLNVAGKNRILNMTTSFVALSEKQEETEKLEESLCNLILPNNRTLKALTNLIDVTTRDLHNSLHKLEQFQGAIEESTIYSITDKKGIIKSANQNFANLSEYTEEELIGKPHNIVRHPDMPSSAFADMWSTIKKGESWRGTVKNRKKNGGHYYVNAHIFPIFDSEGEIEEYISIRDDITEEEERRQRLEGDLQTAENDSKTIKNLLSQYENIIDSNSAIVRFNRENTITYVNKGFCEIHGCPVANCKTSSCMVGKKIADIYDRKSFKRAVKSIYRTILKKKVWKEVTKNKRPTGEFYYADTTITPILDVNGQLIEHMIIFHDITDLMTAKKDIEETQKDVIFKMGAVGEVRSEETGHHVKRVAEYSRVIAQGLGLSYHEINLLRIASPMHDIGKVGIPDSILNKPGRLTEDEYNVMKSHCQLGYEMLKSSKREILQTAAIIALQHHERYDGKGYPAGLKGEEIHLFGRITALADVFDALAAKRVYKDPWDSDKILDYIKKERGGQFDPQVVDVFFKKFEEIAKIKEKYID